MGELVPGPGVAHLKASITKTKYFLVNNKEQKQKNYHQKFFTRNFLSRISYLLNLLNVFQNPAKNQLAARD